MIGTHIFGSSYALSCQLKRPDPPLLAWSLKQSQWPDFLSSARSSNGRGMRMTEAAANGASAPMPSSADAVFSAVTLPRMVPATNMSEGITESTAARMLAPRRGMASSR